MLVYEKKVDGVRHLFGNYEGSAPTDNDPQLTYKDADGDVLTIVAGDTYLDHRVDGVAGIVRTSDDKPVNVFIGEHQIIGQEVTQKVVQSIRVATMPTKTTYVQNETLDLAGMVVKAKYSDGDEVAVTTYTTSPAAGAALATTGEQTVTVTFSEKTTTFKVTVSAPVVENEDE